MTWREGCGPHAPEVNARVIRSGRPRARSSLTTQASTRSNTRLFSPRSRIGHEAHVPTLEDPPRTHARLSRPHEDRRRPQGALGASRQGPRAALRLTQSRPGATHLARGERRHRLTGVGTFDALFARGRRTQGRWIELVVAPAERAPGRAGLVVGRKALARAVDRNYLKRRVREALRSARPAIADYDLIVRLKRPAPGPELAQAAAEAGRLIAALAERR